METLYIASCVLSLFFIAILAGKKNKGLADQILLAWFIVLFSSVLFLYLIVIETATPWMIELLDYSVFLQGPLLFFYTLALCGKIKGISASQLIHLFPFVFLVALALWMDYTSRAFLGPFSNWIIPVKFLSPLVYILVSMRLISQHRMHIKNLYSTTNHLELKWLSSILWGGIVLMFIGSSSLLLHHLTPLEIPQYGGQYLNIAYSLSIIILGYNGFRQTAVFIQPPLDLGLEKPKQRKEANAAVKYQNSRMDERLAQSVYQKLLNHMDSAKPYLDPDLTLYKLAEQLETTGNKLSHVINSLSGYNFFEFVNKYRIDLVIEKMEITDMRQITLLGLALDCGFNSKASFNRAFKKFSGQTPSEYLKRMDIPNG